MKDDKMHFVTDRQRDKRMMAHTPWAPDGAKNKINLSFQHFSHVEYVDVIKCTRIYWFFNKTKPSKFYFAIENFAFAMHSIEAEIIYFCMNQKVARSNKKLLWKTIQ